VILREAFRAFFAERFRALTRLAVLAVAVRGALFGQNGGWNRMWLARHQLASAQAWEAKIVRKSPFHFGFEML
jgi:hypothetical protein